MMKSAIVIGADGAIGRAILARLHMEGIDATGTSRRSGSPYLPLDLSAPDGWPDLPRADVAYICAAVARLEACEKDPTAARKVNVEGTAALARKLHAAGCFVVFLSTNHVFDGTKPYRKANELPCPINAYGRQKAEAERHIQGAVLRLTKVVERGDPRITAWHEALRAGKNASAAGDIFLCPVTLDNALEALMKIGRDRMHGMHQISGPADFSYFELAQAIARFSGTDPARVHDSSPSDRVPPSFRPRYSSYEPSGLTDVPDIDGIVRYALA